jgi:predicted secreted protein
MGMYHFFKLYPQAMLVFLLVMSITGCTVSQPVEPAQGPPPVQSSPVITQPFAKLLSFTGKVSIMKAGASSWAEVVLGMMLGQNDTIQTVAGSKATIVFFEGSTIELDGVTEIKIAELAVNQSTNASTIKIRQELGKTVNRVEKLVDPASRFEVETPAGSIVVRGSYGIVIVLPDGLTNVQNVEGIWCVRAMGQEVCIPGGMSNTTVPGQPPGRPEPPNPPAWPPPPAPPSQSRSEPPVLTSKPVINRIEILVSCDEFYSFSNIVRSVIITHPGIIQVTLCSNRTTGYSWPDVAVISNSKILQQVSHEYIPPSGIPEGQSGSAGNEVWIFKTLSKGTTKVSMEYKPQWEGGEGVWTFELTVTVK